MNHCLGQKFIIWVKVNCLDMSLKPGTGIPRPRTVHESLYILLEMQHTQMGFHAFKMADKIARKEGHRQVFVEYVNEIADNSMLLFVFTKTSQKLVTIQSPETLKKFSLTNLRGCLYFNLTPGSRDISNRNTGFEQLSTIPLFSLLNE